MPNRIFGTHRDRWWVSCIFPSRALRAARIVPERGHRPGAAERRARGNSNEAQLAGRLPAVLEGPAEEVDLVAAGPAAVVAVVLDNAVLQGNRVSSPHTIAAVQLPHSCLRLFARGRDLFLEPLDALRRLRPRAGERLLGPAFERATMASASALALARASPASALAPVMISSASALAPAMMASAAAPASLAPEVISSASARAWTMPSSASSRALAVISSAVSRACWRRALVCSPTRSSACLTAACGDRLTSSSAIRRLT
jgi:hypothetical protein